MTTNHDSSGVNVGRDLYQKLHPGAAAANKANKVDGSPTAATPLAATYEQGLSDGIAFGKLKRQADQGVPGARELVDRIQAALDQRNRQDDQVKQRGSQAWQQGYHPGADLSGLGARPPTTHPSGPNGI